MSVEKMNCLKGLEKLCIPWWAWACLSISPVALILLIRYLLPRYVDKNITCDTVWSGKIILAKPVYVHNNATLIIKPNTLIICKDSSALIICKDGKLTAEGTQNEAIVFSPEDFSHTVWYGIKILGTKYNDTGGNSTFGELGNDGVIYKASPLNYKYVTAKTPSAFMQGNDDCIEGKCNSLTFVKVLNAGGNDYNHNIKSTTNSFPDGNTTAVSAYQAEGNMINTYVPNSEYIGVLLSDGNFSLKNSVVINSENYSIYTKSKWNGVIDTVLATSGNVNENDLLTDAGSLTNYSDIVYNNSHGSVTIPSSVTLNDISDVIKPALSMRRS